MSDATHSTAARRTTLQIKVEVNAEVTLVQLIGSADMANDSILANALLPVSAARPKVVILDLSELSFISSLTLGTLVDFRRGITRHGGCVTLTRGQPMVQEVLDRTGLASWFVEAVQ